MTTSTQRPIRRALISVYDKTGLAELATALQAAGVSIVSTGSTAATICAAGVDVTEVATLTGFPESLDGRVKTLHPSVHAGILADLRLEQHQQQLAELGVEPFDLVVVNLYPFQDTVASGASYDECIEKIDIGGPSMVRGAAKNHASVTVVVDPADYAAVIEHVEQGFSLSERTALAVKAFRHTAEYDVAVATWLGANSSDEGPLAPWLGATWNRQDVLRYGENPHQRAALYLSPAERGIAQAQVLHGKAMSYNNFTDADAAWRTAHDFSAPAVAVIKHANPCGIAVGADIAEAHRKAHATDPVSAYGGVIAANRPVNRELAQQIAEIFTEVVVAPSYDDDAFELLSKKKNLRLLIAPVPTATLETKPISGGLLAQDRDSLTADGDDPTTWTLAAGAAADAETLADLEFAWRASRAVKSNAILLAHDGAAVGVGMGQVNRVDSAFLAVRRAGDRARGAVAASDAFFPFADGLQILIDGGVRAVVQPGGSIRDPEVIAAAEHAGITMYFTGARHFFH